MKRAVGKNSNTRTHTFAHSHHHSNHIQTNTHTDHLNSWKLTALIRITVSFINSIGWPAGWMVWCCALRVPIACNIFTEMLLHFQPMKSHIVFAVRFCIYISTPVIEKMPLRGSLHLFLFCIRVFFSFFLLLFGVGDVWATTTVKYGYIWLHHLLFICMHHVRYKTETQDSYRHCAKRGRPEMGK